MAQNDKSPSGGSRSLPVLRALAGLSQAELAERAGLSRPTVSHAETGRHAMTARTAAKLARALGYDDAAQMFAAVAVLDVLGQDHDLSPSSAAPGRCSGLGSGSGPGPQTRATEQTATTEGER